MSFSFTPPAEFKFTRGDSIHTSWTDRHPHVTGEIDGETVHKPYVGQTTLGMFDRDIGAHRLEEVQGLAQKYPNVFKDSGVKW